VQYRAALVTDLQLAKHRLTVPTTIDWTKKANRKHFLDYLIKKFNISTMAEVGVRDGRTTFYLLDHNPELTIYAVDKSIQGFYNDTVKEKYQDRLIPIEAFSHIGSTYIEDSSLDLVFIDADHSYKWVKIDIEHYIPKLKDSGWLTGHDIDFPGVNQAVTEQLKDFDVGPNNVWIKRPSNVTSIL
jgi:predicted O-methyltransferase YrrM